MVELKLTEPEAHLLLRAALLGLKGAEPVSQDERVARRLTDKLVLIVPKIEEYRAGAI